LLPLPSHTTGHTVPYHGGSLQYCHLTARTLLSNENRPVVREDFPCQETNYHSPMLMYMHSQDSSPIPSDIILCKPVSGFCINHQIHSQWFAPYCKVQTLTAGRTATMSSADFSPCIRSFHNDHSQWHTMRSPRVMRIHLHTYVCRIYHRTFCTGIGL